MAQELHIAFGPFRLEPLSGHLWRSDDGIALQPRSLVGRQPEVTTLEMWW